MQMSIKLIDRTVIDGYVEMFKQYCQDTEYYDQIMTNVDTIFMVKNNFRMKDLLICDSILIAIAIQRTNPVCKYIVKQDCGNMLDIKNIQKNDNKHIEEFHIVKEIRNIMPQQLINCVDK
jgi:hypothetical protein